MKDIRISLVCLISKLEYLSFSSLFSLLSMNFHIILMTYTSDVGYYLPTKSPTLIAFKCKYEPLRGANDRILSLIAFNCKYEPLR